MQMCVVKIAKPMQSRQQMITKKHSFNFGLKNVWMDNET